MEKSLYLYLKELAIEFALFEHEPVFTCDQAALLKGDLPVHGRVKNLFLKDRRKKYYLVSALHETKIDLKALRKQWDAPELRFASPEELMQVLSVQPGSVTPFALLADKERRVTVFFDHAIMLHEKIGIHPLRNDKTVLISPRDAERFVHSLGYSITLF